MALKFLLETFVPPICQGVRCKRVARSIASVGLYVPGGTAVLPSTALMLSVVWWFEFTVLVAISIDLILHIPWFFVKLSEIRLTFVFSSNQPAQIAGCKTIVLATPPGRDGSICKVLDIIVILIFIKCYL